MAMIVTTMAMAIIIARFLVPLFVLFFFFRYFANVGSLGPDYLLIFHHALHLNQFNSAFRKPSLGEDHQLCRNFWDSTPLINPPVCPRATRRAVGHEHPHM